MAKQRGKGHPGSDQIATTLTRHTAIEKAKKSKRKREITAETLAEDLAAFLAAGGKIQEIPIGVSNDQVALNTKFVRGHA